MTVQADNGNGGVTLQTIEVTLTDVAETPSVESVGIDDDAETNCDTDCQSSMVRKLTVSFDQKVAISGAFSLTHTLNGTISNFTIDGTDVATSIVGGRH